jgi:hypothetical protein
MPHITKANKKMNRFYLSTRLKIYVSVFVGLNLLTTFSVILAGEYRHWIWLFPMLGIALAVFIFRRMKMPFNAMKQIDDVLKEMLEGQFTSRVTQVPCM